MNNNAYITLKNYTFLAINKSLVNGNVFESLSFQHLSNNERQNTGNGFFVKKTNVAYKVEWHKIDKVIQIDNKKYSVSNDETENKFSLKENFRNIFEYCIRVGLDRW